jgi:starch phosphorylase
VPAGNETFKLDMMEKYFPSYVATLAYPRGIFPAWPTGDNPSARFFDDSAGASDDFVSQRGEQLHGRVAQNMWRNIWKVFPPDVVPIKSVTNGIHTMNGYRASSPSFSTVFVRLAGAPKRR